MTQEACDQIERQSLALYTQGLIGRFYKILPLCESQSPTLDKYMNSLLREMLGCEQLVMSMRTDDRFVILLAILQSLILDHSDVPVVKTDVFRAINLITQLRDKYTEV